MTPRNLAVSSEEASAVVLNLLQVLEQPVIVERFLPGREVSICVVGNRSGAKWLEAVAWKINGDLHYLNNKLFTSDIKTSEVLAFEAQLLTDKLQPKPFNRQSGF